MAMQRVIIHDDSIQHKKQQLKAVIRNSYYVLALLLIFECLACAVSPRIVSSPAAIYLYHSFVESPDMMNIYNGIVRLDGQGQAEVEMPVWFEALNSDFSYQLTALGAASPNLHIAGEIKDCSKFCWLTFTYLLKAARANLTVTGLAASIPAGRGVVRWRIFCPLAPGIRHWTSR